MRIFGTPDDGWTVATLKEHLERRLDDLRSHMDERHRHEQKAVAKAEQAADQRFESMNEFRGQLSDQATTFLTREEYNAKHETLHNHLDALEHRMDELRGRNLGVRLSVGAIVGTLSALAAFVTIVVIVNDLLTR